MATKKVIVFGTTTNMLVLHADIIHSRHNVAIRYYIEKKIVDCVFRKRRAKGVSGKHIVGTRNSNGRNAGLGACDERDAT